MISKCCLGIELGSTRIKACLIDENCTVVAMGSCDWENKLENGYWTYSLDAVHLGLKECYASLCRDVMDKFGVVPTSYKAIGISGMMHGYLAFDENYKLLTPFRTWRNATTAKAALSLSELFDFNIPQRWSIAHLYQAILNGEEHVGEIRHMTTLCGYIQYLLTGQWELGICEASGMFPVLGDDYNPHMLQKFTNLISDYGFKWNVKDILPKVRLAGYKGSSLTEEGARFLDETGNLKAGIPLCPPEGDMGTGMVATNSVREKRGNVSVGTSANSLLVLDKPIKGKYEEIDIVTTPDGYPVAMAHSNNGCSELDVWVNIFGEFTSLMGNKLSKSDLYSVLYNNALNGDADCGGVISYNFLADEPSAGVTNGRPAYWRIPDGKINLANFFKSQIYSVFAVLKIGMDILFDKENISAESFTAHGGIFKVEGVAQQLMANAFGVPVSVSDTAAEGGAWGMALLAAYMVEGEGMSLADWLDNAPFSGMKKVTLNPDKEGVKGFEEYYKKYKASLSAVAMLQ